MSTTWKDSQSREWICRLTVAEAMRLKSDDGIDLLNAEVLAEHSGDPLKAIFLLVRIHAEQWKEEGLTHGDFAEICTESEDIAIAAADCLMAALSDFYRRLRMPALADVVEKADAAAKAASNRAQQLLADRGDAAIATVVGQIDRELSEALDNVISGGSLFGK
jgi:hypothetical protein